MPSFFTPVLPSAAGLALGSPNLPWTIYSNQTIPTFANKVVNIAWSPTPILDATGCLGLEMLLTGDVTSSTFVSGASPGLGTGTGYVQLITFLIQQDGVGHHKFTWPTSFFGCRNVDNVSLNMNPGQIMMQMIYYRFTTVPGGAIAAAPALII